MSKLIEDILINNNNIKIKSVFGDGSFYDSNENFKYFQKKRIRSAIKVRKNSIISLAQDVQLYINKFYNNICNIFLFFDYYKNKFNHILRCYHLPSNYDQK
jgi:hypothetical protein